jgi:4a-hydroxytetrahydrobiopterin dehydratase
MKDTWLSEDQKLTKTFTFNTFLEALSFVKKVGEIAEQMQHHPDIFIHDYKIVTISTTTHDSGTITEKDYELAQKIDEIV